MAILATSLGSRYIDRWKHGQVTLGIFTSVKNARQITEVEYYETLDEFPPTDWNDPGCYCLNPLPVE